MADNIYNIGLTEFFTRMSTSFKAFKEAFRKSGFSSPNVRPFANNRKAADTFFSRSDAVKDATEKQREESNDKLLLASENQLHLGRCLEQDFKMRYTCGRNHAIATGVNEAWRLEVDLPIIQRGRN